MRTLLLILLVALVLFVVIAAANWTDRADRAAPTEADRRRVRL